MMAWAMYYVSVLRAVVCMLVACLYLCQAQFFGGKLYQASNNYTFIMSNQYCDTMVVPSSVCYGCYIIAEPEPDGMAMGGGGSEFTSNHTKYKLGLSVQHRQLIALHNLMDSYKNMNVVNL